ncbi:MAG TPA: SgcJ/EcaC family oxidoreductase [Verrucomicrobiota bacterium]|nr:SgcJ/EcaC family oxidoreductase [Verrucomicrobiota bacterium]HRT09265.1 SgcJ/EcaC family oxidoreductase [Candidatus Paceibacterota bacterium]HRT58124.1 SgcJ/EcaC family oxidoreductase [Candidatus Paceibacterota bacterium]
MKGYLAIVAALTLAGCADAKNTKGDINRRDREADLKAIKQLAADWRAGWLAGDVEALLSLYADDPVLLPQGQPAVSGKAAIRELYQAVFKEVVITSESSLMEMEISGNLGYFWSTYKISATPKAGGAPIQSEGKSLFVVRRVAGGAWKIARLMDNSSR